MLCGARRRHRARCGTQASAAPSVLAAATPSMRRAAAPSTYQMLLPPRASHRLFLRAPPRASRRLRRRVQHAAAVAFHIHAAWLAAGSPSRTPHEFVSVLSDLLLTWLLHFSLLDPATSSKCTGWTSPEDAAVDCLREQQPEHNRCQLHLISWMMPSVCLMKCTQE